MPRGLWVAANRGFHDVMLLVRGIPSPTGPPARMGPSPPIVSARSSGDSARRWPRGGVSAAVGEAGQGDGGACRQGDFANGQVPFSAARRALSADVRSVRTASSRVS